MSLNPETAMYIYKIIAIKELFEHPEYYMEDFGANIFAGLNHIDSSNIANSSMDSSLFNSLQVSDVAANDNAHPDNMNIKEPPKPTNADLITTQQQDNSNIKFKYLLATINEIIRALKMEI